MIATFVQASRWSWVAIGLICLSPVSAWGQIRDLATTDDGKRLYFSSTLRLKGSDQHTNAKIFRYSGGEYGLVAQVVPSVTLGDGSVFDFAYRMPTVSGDGTIETYDGTASCSGGPSCSGAFTTAGSIVGADLPRDMTWYGSLRVSHNGRYVLRVGGGPATTVQAASLHDLQSGQTFWRLICDSQPCTVPGDARGIVADDGTVLTDQGLWRNGQVQPLKLARRQVMSRISSDGRKVIYESVDVDDCAGDLAFGSCRFTSTLYAYDATTNTELRLASGPSYRQNARAKVTASLLPSLSADGRFVLFRGTNAQLIVAATDGSSARQITDVSLGIEEGVLSGNGQYAYAVTKNGGLLSVEVSSGQVHTLLSGDVPTVTGSTGPMVPGSLTTLTGSSFVTPAGALRLSFTPALPSVTSLAQESITIQLPWDVNVNQQIEIAGANAESPFEQVSSFQPVLAAPRVLGIYRSDFTPLNTWNTFATSGEIIILHMTGLGPVTLTPITGQAAPLDRPSRVILPLSCVWGTDQPAQIPFAGLAPGLIGVYQVNIVAPNLQPGDLAAFVLRCASVLPSGDRSTAAKTTIFVAGK